MSKFLTTLVTATLLLSNTTFASEGIALTLDDAIALALKNNQLIEQSKADREAAKWNLSAVRRSSGPTLSWTSSLNHIGGRYYRLNRLQHDEAKLAAKYNPTINPHLYPSYDNENVNSLNLSMPLYTGGRLENQRESARYDLNAADLNLENARQTVKYQTAVAYYQVLQQKSLIDVQEQAVQLLQAHLRNVVVQYEVGTVAKSDVLATNVQLANSQQNLNSARGNYQIAVAQLNNILGLPVDTEIAANAEINFVHCDLTEADCLEFALKNRPDGVAALYTVKRAQAQTATAKSGYRPNINAVISGNESGEGLFKADHNGERWAVGVELSWNIFDNGVTAAQVEQYKAIEKRALSLNRQQIDNIELEVRSAYINLKTAEENIATTATAVDKAEEEFSIAQVRYVEGVDTNLNVMNAQEKVVETRNNYYTALYNYSTGRAQLEKAMGVPIVIDATLYFQAEQAGKNPYQALKEAAVVGNYNTLVTNHFLEPFSKKPTDN